MSHKAQELWRNHSSLPSLIFSMIVGRNPKRHNLNLGAKQHSLKTLTSEKRHSNSNKRLWCTLCYFRSYVLMVLFLSRWLKETSMICQKDLTQYFRSFWDAFGFQKKHRIVTNWCRRCSFHSKTHKRTGICFFFLPAPLSTLVRTKTSKLLIFVWTAFMIPFFVTVSGS